MLTIILLLIFVKLSSCSSKVNDLNEPTSSVKIIVNGLDKLPSDETINVHISGVNLDINEDPTLSNYFKIRRTFKNVSDLVENLTLEQKYLSKGKWRIAIELVDWKTACSIMIQNKETRLLIFNYKKQLCL